MKLCSLKILVLSVQLLLVSFASTSMQVLAANTKPVITKSQAIEAAKSEVKGKVLSANLIASKGPPIYRVKMLVGKSRVRIVFVDGKNGKVIKIN
jgi:uncharacterized membrane protein YkoI